MRACPNFSVNIQCQYKYYKERAKSMIIIIFCCWDTGLPYGLHIRITPHGPSTGWSVLTSANAAMTNGLTCLPKHGGTRDSKYLVTHLMTDQRCLT
jgi:hypothetical protein